MLAPRDAEKSRAPGSALGPVGLFTCDAPGHPHSQGLCSCGLTWFRRLPPTPGGTSGPSMTPCPFPPFGSPVSAAAEPTAAAAALPGARGELQRALPLFAPFVDSSPDSAAATPAPAAAAALPGARGGLQRALPTFAPFVDSSPDSAAATPAPAAAAALPRPEGLQNALMFGAAAPPAATDPAVGATTASIHGSCNGSPSGSRAPSVAAGAQTPCMPAPPARSPEGGLALDGIISTRHSPALRFSPRAGLWQPPVSDEAVLMEVEVLRIDIGPAARSMY